MLSLNISTIFRVVESLCRVDRSILREMQI